MELNKYIDHTNLKNTGTLKDIEKLCNEAIKYKFASVCVYPFYVRLAANLLKGTNVEVCTVIGFPSGIQPCNITIFILQPIAKLPLCTFAIDCQQLRISSRVKFDSCKPSRP